MKRVIVFSLLCLFFMGCSVSPYQNGINLAEEYDGCVEAYFEATEKVGEDFAMELPGKYTSRSAAMNEYLNLLRECYQTYLKKWNALEDKEVQVRKKAKNTSDLREFETGLASREMHVFVYEPDLETVEISPAVLQKVKLIFPQKPNEAQIAADLVGHSLLEGKTKGYYPQNWKWVIEENSVSDFKIVSIEEDSKNHYSVTATLRVSSDTRAYDVKVFVSYLLDDISDWKIEYIQSKGMDIVQTHRYDDCVTCYIEGYFLVAENNCDIALEVAGRELHHDEWITFCGIVPPLQKKVISNNYTDFRVDYIERP